MIVPKRNPVTPKFLDLGIRKPSIKDPLSVVPPIKRKIDGTKLNRRAFIRELIKAGIVDVNAVALQLRRHDYPIPSVHALTDYISRSKEVVGVRRNFRFKGLREERKMRRNLL